MRILVLRGGALGDFILTLPVLAALRRAFPAARIEVLGTMPQAKLAPADVADSVHDLNCQDLLGLFIRGADFSAKWTERLRKTDLAISYLADPEDVVVSQLQRARVGQVVRGPYRFDSRMHAVDQLAAPLSGLGIPLGDRFPRLPRVQSDDFQPTLALHPGSGSPRKNWPLERWMECLIEIERDWPRILLITGEADLPISREMRAFRLPPHAIRLELPTLGELVAALSSCQLFLGHDSGVTHLAAALGLPTIALFGPTDPSIWAPLGTRVIVLQSATGEMEGLSVEQVLAAIRSQRTL